MNLVLALVFMCVTAEGLEEPRLVYPRLLEERSSDGKLVLHVHDELTLNLEQASVAAPQLRFIDERDGFSVTEMVDGKEINSNLYQDRDQLATVEVKLTEGNAEIRGIVGPNHRIEPVLTTERSESGLIPHMVHEIQHAKVRDQAISFVEKAKRFHLTARNYHTEDKVPEEVIVEAFFVADRSYYSTFKGNREALVYVCMLLNSVNLRMTDMKNPRVRIALTGLESAAQHEYLQGVSKNMHDNAALRAFQKYGERKKNDFGNPDIVFLLSWTEGTQGSDGKWRSRATGIAYVSGVCTRFYVGLGEDAPGVFTGVHTVTHEIGHLLGSEHDETGPSSFVPGHPGAKACRWSDGYIMSYVDKDANHHKFSRCSLDQMRHVLRVRGKACWEVVSRLENVTNKYPGYRNVTRKICMRAFPKKPNVQAELIYPRGDECKLQCLYWEQIGYFTRYHRTFRDVPDFTPCGHNRVCVRGRCVPGTIPRKN